MARTEFVRLGLLWAVSVLRHEWQHRECAKCSECGGVVQFLYIGTLTAYDEPPIIRDGLAERHRVSHIFFGGQSPRLYCFHQVCGKKTHAPTMLISVASDCHSVTRVYPMPHGTRNLIHSLV